MRPTVEGLNCSLDTGCVLLLPLPPPPSPSRRAAPTALLGPWLDTLASRLLAVFFNPAADTVAALPRHVLLVPQADAALAQQLRARELGTLAKGATQLLVRGRAGQGIKGDTAGRVCVCVSVFVCTHGLRVR